MINITPRLLLVEDDEDDYILTCDYLEQLSTHHFAIDWVTNQDDALAEMSKNCHDICLLDYQLGAENGLTVLKRGIKAGFTSPIIMLTGQADEKVDLAALDAGAVDYLIKSELSGTRFARSIRYALARREIEKERVDRLKAEAENRSKDRFLAHLSHELRTPLTSILGYTQVLIDSEPQGKAKTQLGIVLNNSKHLLSLLNNMLDLSKIAADKLELNITEVSLDSLIADVFALMRVAAHEKGLTLTISSVSPLPVQIYTDETRLRQVLINLISNAIKFTDKGKIKVRFWVEQNIACHLLYFDVSDTGIGIPEDKRISIFKPFEQVADVVSRHQGGSGLGLAICTELTAKMGGAIKLDSTFGAGSRFTVHIATGDVSQVRHEELIFDAKPCNTHSTEAPSYRGKVLVVDDVNDIRMLIGQLVSATGLTVEYAKNGLEALDCVKSSIIDQQPYDLVLIDIHMPVMDGTTAIKHIRAENFNGPVVAMTAATMKGVRRELMEQGFTKVLEKPINHDALIYVLKSCMQIVRVKEEGFCAQAMTSDLHYLLVEDDRDAADITALLLEKLGVNVQIAYSGQQCLELFAQRTDWTKVLLDLHLPDENGFVLAKKLRQQNPCLDIVILSGDQPEDVKLQEAGIHTFLLKPINRKILADLVSSG
ncbi:MAG: two-component system sensor histidine kinase/response regulator [Paraglaciecola sp.]|jgi:two-component system sensor histidine kinase/response regulator